ncbi:hypothetical protein [Paenibacillus apiarius]|uniref:hypothetical protein n=1 Tax=Paenibacillus apiarius TaxID=46240 RepID=UPI003B3A1A2C
MTTQDVSKAVFTQMETLLEEASKLGAEGVVEHFKSLAYALGVQMALEGEPEKMAEFINAVVTEIGRGLRVGMETTHGITGHFDVQVHSVKRSRF